MAAMGAVILVLLAAMGNVDGLDASFNYRARAYDPSLGRFLQRDPIGIWGDGINFGNGYGYLGENPGNGVDPEGFRGEYRDYDCKFEGISQQAQTGSKSNPSVEYDEGTGAKLCLCKCKYNCGKCPKISCAVKKSVGPGAGLIGAWYNWVLAKWEDQEFEGEAAGEVQEGVNTTSILASECTETTCTGLQLTCQYDVPEGADCNNSAFAINAGKAINIATIAYMGAAAAASRATITARGLLARGPKGGGGGLGANPFKGKTPQEIDKILRGRGFQPRGPDPINGRGGYVNPKTGRSYHTDPGGQYKAGVEPPHVDVNRVPGQPGSNLPKRKYPL